MFSILTEYRFIFLYVSMTILNFFWSKSIMQVYYDRFSQEDKKLYYIEMYLLVAISFNWMMTMPLNIFIALVSMISGKDNNGKTV